VLLEAAAGNDQAYRRQCCFIHVAHSQSLCLLLPSCICRSMQPWICAAGGANTSDWPTTGNSC
jgi:hypothetical protein